MLDSRGGGSGMVWLRDLWQSRLIGIGIAFFAAALFLESCSFFHGSESVSGNSSEKSQAAAVAAPTVPATNSHGYALLFDLVRDEKDVSKLRFIKHERPE